MSKETKSESKNENRSNKNHDEEVVFDKNIEEEVEENSNSDENQEQLASEDDKEENSESSEKSFRKKARKEIDELKKKCSEYQNMCQRVGADFENFKKRTAKERENTYQDALAEAVNAFLPVLDNVERALNASKEACEEGSLQEGVEMVCKQFNEVFSKLGIVEIRSVGEKFNPEYHNAVMHVDDESYGENQVVEEFQKGYVLGEKVIRHSMVKVAN